MNFVVERIEQLRAQRGWTVYKLSQESGVPETTIHRWIGTKICPQIPLLVQVCDAFTITLAEFFAKGELVELTDEKKEFHNTWHSLTKSQQETIMSMISHFTAGKK